MALRFYMDFPALPQIGDDLRVEIHDDEYVATAQEFTGDPNGFVLDWGGSKRYEAGPWPSSVKVAFLHENSIIHNDFMDDIKGAREGRFHIVVRINNKYHPFYLVPDQLQLPDEYENFHVQLFGVDGMQRLKDMDYVDTTTGNAYTGRQTVIEHLFNIIEHLGLSTVVSLESGLLKTTGNYYATGMDSTTCPYNQVTIDNDLFTDRDDAGVVTYWSCWEVLEAICCQFNCRFFFSEGAYYFQQIELYADDTQKEYSYLANGTFLGTVAAQDYDTDIDYSSASGGWKRRGGVTTYLQAAKEVKVIYNHLTLRNFLQGLTFPDAEAPFDLNGSIPVPNINETQLQLRLPFSIIANWSGVGSMPAFRLKFKVTLSFDTDPNETFLKRLSDTVLTNNTQFLAPPVYQNATWATTGSDKYLEYITGIFETSMEGFTVIQTLDFTAPYLPTSVDGQRMQINIEEVHAVDIDGNTYSSSSDLSWTWSVLNGQLTITNDGIDGIADTGATVFSQVDDTDGNTLVIEKPTYFGDGPNALTLGKLQLVTGTADTTTWTLGGSGTTYGINELLARQILAMRMAPVDVFQVTFIKGGIKATSRITDNSTNYMPLSLTYIAKDGFWSGEYAAVSVSADAQTGSNEPGTPYEPNGPTTGPLDPPGTPGGSNSTQGFSIPPVIAGQISATSLNGSQTAATINSTNPNRLTVNTVNFPFAFAGDQISLVDPTTGQNQLFTVATDYQPNTTFLEVSTTATMNFPSGSYLVPSPAMLLGARGWSYKDLDFTGTELNIPTATGFLPNNNSLGENVIDTRVEVIAGGVRFLYSENGEAGTYDILTEHNRIIFSQKIRGAAVQVIVR